jgi:hypothetical protein
MARSATEEMFIGNKVTAALAAAGIPTNNAKLRAELERNAMVDVSGREASVRWVKPDGSDVSLMERLNELRNSPEFESAFPAPPRKVVDHRDINQLRENFADVAAGKIAVE